MKKLLFLCLCSMSINLFAHPIDQSKGSFEDKFRQLDEIFPDPNQYRAATGEPTKLYWQQQADYKIEVELFENQRSLKGSETITYKNNSPLVLNYIWIQLDQNIFKKDSISNLAKTFSSTEKISFGQLKNTNFMEKFEGGMRNIHIHINGDDAQFTTVGTMLRIDLAEPLEEQENLEIEIDWEYNIPDATSVRARNGYESFEDGNDIFLIAQWYPRVVV